MDTIALSAFILGILFLSHTQVDAKVFELDHKNFDEVINENAMAIVMFYAPWCGACKAALPRFAEASSKFKKERDVIFARVDAFHDRILSLKFNVDRFPTTYIFPYSTEGTKYTDPLTVETITKTLKAMWKKENKTPRKKVTIKKPIKTKPVTGKRDPKTGVVEIGIEDFHTIVLDPRKHVMIMFYAPGCTTDCETYGKIASAFINEESLVFCKIDVTTDIKIAQNFNILKNPTLYWFPKNDKDMGSRYGGDMDHPQIVEFVNDETGTARSEIGELLPTAGRIKAMDDLMKENIDDIVNARSLDSIITKARQLVKSSIHDKKYLNYYMKLLEDIKSTTDADIVIQREYDFINENLAEAKTKKSSDEMVKLRNILGAFVDYAAAAVLDMPGLGDEIADVPPYMLRDEL
ncbi:uncharacterized protein LOC141901938 [Tubulanus polymorphus]|uniref:uncharacterized protein LOC141901938 n=1 Tax=Tubulanus polymorphus TaxID=672921 RepID=UPI003DA48243